MSHCYPPPSLRPGACLGIVAPAGPVHNRDAFYQGLQVLQELGYRLKFPRSLWPGGSYLADSDANRAREFNAMLADPEVDGLLCARGGFGCLRMAGALDVTQFRRTPKALVGFSDISVLLNLVVNGARQVTFHGPVVTTLAGLSRPALERFHLSLQGSWHLPLSSPGMQPLQGKGVVTGQLVGGNLATLVSLLGTPFDFSWRDKIVLLEDVGEENYRIDRMFTQLLLAGKFTGVRGVLLGDFRLQSDMESLSLLRYQEAVWECFLEIMGNTALPVWGGVPSGHCPDNHLLPLGADVTMEPGDVCLFFQA